VNSFISDKDLVDAVRNGRREEFGVLVERHIAAANAVAYARLANAVDAEDAVQDAFLLAFKRIGTLRDAAKFASWLLAITRNEATRIAAGRHASAPLDAAAVAEHAAQTPDTEQRDLNALLRAHIQKLPGPAREILLLHYFAGKNSREIAELLDINQSAVLKRLQRAREQLAETLLRDLEAARPREASTARQVTRIVALTSTVSLANAVAGTTTVSAAAATILFPKAATIAAAAVGAAVTLAGIAGLAWQAREQPTHAQREQAVIGAEQQSELPRKSSSDVETAAEPSGAAAAQAASEAGGTAEQGRPGAAANRPGEADLSRKVTIAFEDTHLAEILAFLQEETNIPFLIDRGAVGVPGKSTAEPVPPTLKPYEVDGKIATVRVQNQPLYEALDSILADAGLKLVLAPGYLWISTPDQIRRDGRSYPASRYENYSKVNLKNTNKRVDLAFDDVHVSEVIQFVQEAYDEDNIGIDWRVIAPAEGPFEAPVFTGTKRTDGKVHYVNLKGIRLEDALQLITRTLNMTTVIRKDYLWLTSEEMIRRDGITPLTLEERKPLDKVLAGPITVAFEDVSVLEILQFINEIYTVNVAVDQRVLTWEKEPAAGASVTAPEKSMGTISHGVIRYINVKNASLLSVLDILTRDLDLAYEVRRDAVIVSNAKRLALGSNAADLVPAAAFLGLTKEAMHIRESESAASLRPPHLIQIRQVSDGYEALIDTGRRPNWFAEGEIFGTYILTQIDAKAGCVELLDNESNKTQRICGVTSKF